MHRSVIQLKKAVTYFSWMNTLGRFCITFQHGIMYKTHLVLASRLELQL